jgi:hypothetical protein
MSDSTEQAIEQAATSPKRVTVDGQTVEGRPIREMIDADKHLESKKAAQSKGLGIRIHRISPGGTV